MGRPRKSAIIENVAPQKVTVAKTKSVKSVETLEREVQELITLSTAAVEAQIEAHQMASEAEDKFKALAKETERCLNMINDHCYEVQRNTGSLTSEDVEYSVSLIKRVIENKFKKD